MILFSKTILEDDIVLVHSDNYIEYFEIRRETGSGTLTISFDNVNWYTVFSSFKIENFCSQIIYLKATGANIVTNFVVTGDSSDYQIYYRGYWLENWNWGTTEISFAELILPFSSYS